MSHMNQPLPKRRRQMAPELASVVGIGSFVSDDVLFFHILVLLPVKCLVRLQSVCKLWRATITSSHFVRRHLELSRSRLTMCVVPRKYHKDPSIGSQFFNIYRFEPGHNKVAELIFQKNFFPSAIQMFTIPLHSDGMILIPCTSGKIYMCNPATREFVQLPQGNQSISLGNRLGFGFDPRSGTYKVAKPFIRSYTEIEDGIITKYTCGYEILTIGDGKETWKWKATVDPPYPIKARTPVCLPGFFYWSAIQSVASHGKVESDVILRFSLFDESFTVHPNPPCRGFLSAKDVLSELSGKLCYLYSASSWEIAIWLAEDGPNLNWSICCRVKLPILMNRLVLPCASAEPDKIFLAIDACFLFKCHLRDATLEHIINMGRDLLFDHMNGIKFTTSWSPIAHYMVPVVESMLRIRPLQC